jgi:hypothetical protein
VDLLAVPGKIELAGGLGGTVSAGLTVRNVGERTVEGIVLHVVGHHALAPGKRYRNCEYPATGPHYPTPVQFTCTFDRSLAPGETARVDAGFGFAIPRNAWAPNTQYGSATWLTPADWAALRTTYPPGARSGPKGTDGVLGLSLVEDTRQRAAGDPQSDLDPENNKTEIELTIRGKQQADVVADGARVSAEVGRTVPITVGFTNRGPAVVNAWGQALNAAIVFEVPEGTTVVQTTRVCSDHDIQDEDPGRPGARRYHCEYRGVLAPGKKAEFPFTLRVDRPGRHTGTITLRNNRKDLKPANDVAQVVVDTTGSGDGGEGGGLPITGAPVVTIAGVGLLLVVAGGAAFLLTRRRSRPGVPAGKPDDA